MQAEIRGQVWLAQGQCLVGSSVSFTQTYFCSFHSQEWGRGLWELSRTQMIMKEKGKKKKDI